MTRWLAVGSALAALTLTSCAGPFVAPTTTDECYGSGRDQRGTHSADTDSSWVMTFSEGDRALGSVGTIYVCVPDDRAGTITARMVAPRGAEGPPPEGAAVEPLVLRVTAGDTTPPEVHVTVTEGTEHSVLVSYEDESGSGGTSHVRVEADEDSWSFESR